MRDIQGPEAQVLFRPRTAQNQAFAGMEMLGAPGGDDPGVGAGGGGDAPVMLAGLSSDVPIVRRHGSCYRRLQLLGSDGRSRHFTVQMGQTFLSTPGMLLPARPRLPPVPFACCYVAHTDAAPFRLASLVSSRKVW